MIINNNNNNNNIVTKQKLESNKGVRVTSVCTMPCRCSLMVLTTSEISNWSEGQNYKNQTIKIIH